MPERPPEPGQTALPPSRRPPRTPAPGPRVAPSLALASALLTAITLLFGWWAWRRGAFFGTVFYPGAMGLLAVASVLLLVARWPGRLRGPAAIALGALALLGAWTLLSALWSPAPDVAIEDGARTLSYALSFALGAWLCLLLGRRMYLAMAPVAVVTALVGVATLAVLLTGSDVTTYLESDTTLRYPLGYRNAAAAFFLIGFWPLLALASSSAAGTGLRIAAAAAGTMSFQLAILAQSRTSLFAFAIGAILFIVASRLRLRALVWGLAALLAGLPALPLLLDLYQQGGGATAESIGPLRDAAGAIIASAVLSVGFALIALRVENRGLMAPGAKRAVGRGLTVGAVALCVLAAGAVTARDGGPIGFAQERIDQLTSGGTPEFSDRGQSRFGLNLGSNRGDFWRVSLDDAEAEPLTGNGAGGFQYSYLRDRDSGLSPDDPHSVVMQLLGELGVPGLGMLAAFVIAAAMAAIRSRRLGPAAASLTAAALAAGGYWLVHASVDWLWIYPGITAPVMFLLGAAAAPALLTLPAPAVQMRRRLGAVALAGAAAGLMLPFFLAERYTDNALRDWRGDRNGAYTDLERAGDLNPLTDRGALVEVVIAEALGDDRRALAAADEAIRRKPEFWGSYYLRARLLAEEDPMAALEELRLAEERNPRSPEVEELKRSLSSR